MSRCMSARWLSPQSKRMKARAFTAVLPLRPSSARAGAFHCPLIVSHRYINGRPRQHAALEPSPVLDSSSA
ncbi:hypothetical protein K523DRAFT_245319 [Schizophyllum commune Tattone D]|nr:hypothetical protein K523DRAFT_245319 [Schizophyllum commune Tattone D]